MRVSIRSTILAFASVALAACGYDSKSPRSVLEPTTAVARALTRTGFGFNGTASGFLTGKVFLTGGGSFDVSEATNGIPTDSTVRSSGGFRCIEPVSQGPLTNCGEGEGVRWDTVQLLESTPFKCTGKATEPNKTAFTSSNRVVLKADFYRAGDANEESFTANIIISETDLDPDIDGVQNIWVQGVGCASGVVSFNNARVAQ